MTPKEKKIADLLACQTKQANAEFERMSPSEKRVAIAKDVLLRIKDGNIIPTQGYYVVNSILNPPRDTDKIMSMAQRQTQCVACAKGSIFISCLGFREDIDTSEAEVGGDPSYALYDIFEPGQLDAIEHAFEAWGSASRKAEDEGLERYGNWGSEYETPGKRLEAICKNIISNNGEFIIP